MITTIPNAGPARSWLVPGQTLRSTEPGRTGVFTVARIIRDSMGLCHAVLHDAKGQEISTFVEQIHFSIAEGMLTPVEATPSRISFN